MAAERFYLSGLRLFYVLLMGIIFSCSNSLNSVFKIVEIGEG